MDLDQAKPLGAIDLSVKATPYPPAKPRLKTSCLICRAKKIRCDGEKPCSRCKTRGAECIYRESTGQVGRPPKNAVLNKMVSQRPKGSTQNIFVLENLNWSSVRESSALFNGYVSSTFGQANPDQPKIIERLMNIYTSFFRQFRFSDLPPNVLEDSDNNYPLVSVRNASLGFVYLQEVSSVIMMCDAVQLIVSKISSLPVDTYGRLKYYPQNIANDTSTSFSDQMPQPIVSMPNPIKALTPQQALQLIDTFFYLHPFSIILNKTLVLQNFWTDTGDPLLYSAIFASASLLSKIREFKQSQRPGDLFLAHAYSIISTSTTQNTLSKLQAFIILAWHENMVDNGKKGTALMSLAWNTIAELKIRFQDARDGKFDHPMNRGLHPLERELRNNCFWAMYIITAWGCLQLGQPPRLVFRPHYIDLPCLNESQSESYRLDEESGNSTPFESQIYSIRCFYASSKVCELVARIWMLLPDPNYNLFSDIHLNPINPSLCLPPIPTPSTTGRFYSDVVDLLIQFPNTIPSDLDPPTHYPLLISYHVLMIHVHFPRSQTPPSSADDPTVTLFPDNTHQIAEKELHIVADSANMILELTHELLNNHHIQFAPRLTAFALDTCAKVYMVIVMRYSGPDSPSAGAGPNSMAPEREHAQRSLQKIYQILKSDDCLRANVRALKKSVKAFLIQVGAWIDTDNTMGNISHSMMMMSLASISQSVVDHTDESRTVLLDENAKSETLGAADPVSFLDAVNLQMDLNQLQMAQHVTMEMLIDGGAEGMLMLLDRENDDIMQHFAEMMELGEKGVELEGKIYIHPEDGVGEQQPTKEETAFFMGIPSPVASTSSTPPPRDLPPSDGLTIPIKALASSISAMHDHVADAAKYLCVDELGYPLLESSRLTPGPEEEEEEEEEELVQSISVGMGGPV